MRRACTPMMLLFLLTGCERAEGKPSPQPEPESPPARPVAADDGFGEVAFKTFDAGGNRIVFITPTKARVTWKNMSGSAVEGSYTQKGREITIEWDRSATNWGSSLERFRQMDPCSMARYERLGLDGKPHQVSPMIYQQTKPRCHAVRVGP